MTYAFLALAVFVLVLWARRRRAERDPYDEVQNDIGLIPPTWRDDEP